MKNLIFLFIAVVTWSLTSSCNNSSRQIKRFAEAPKIKAQDDDVSFEDYDDLFAYLLNSNDIFTLKKQEELIDSIQNIELKNLANSMVNFYFNKPQESNYYIKKLFRESTGNSGLENNMKRIMSENYRRLGYYDSAFYALKELIKNPEISSDNDIKIASGLKNISMANIIAFDTSAIKLEKDSIFGLSIVSVHDSKKEEHEFILDTGAAYSTLLESDCKNFGIKIMADSLIFNGEFLKLGIAPIVEIGKTKIKNAIFLIIPDSIGTISILNSHRKLNVIGLDILRKSDNVEITETSLTFNKPTNYQTKALNNMAFEGGFIIVNVNLVSETPFIFDTGSNVSFLCPIYENDLVSFEKGDTTITVGGAFDVGEINPTYYYNVPIRVTDSLKVIPKLMVSSKHCPYGLLGKDVTELFSKIILDFKNMTFLLE